MKSNHILQTLLIALTLAWATSCSDSNSFSDYYGNDNRVICSINMYEVLDNAGFDFSGDKVTMSTGLHKIIGANVNNVTDVLSSIKGFDPRKVVLVNDCQNNSYAVARLSDASAFEKSLADNGYEKTSEGGYTLMSKVSKQYIIDGNMVVLGIESSLKGAKLVDAIKANADKHPIPGWQSDILDKDNTANIILSIDNMGTNNDPQLNMAVSMIWSSMYEDGLNGCYSALECNLDGLEAKIDAKLYSAQGKTKKCLWCDKSLDKRMLKYTSANDLMVMLCTLSGDGWKSLADTFANMSLYGEDLEVVRSLYQDLGGKFMLSLGYSNLNALINNDFSNFNFTLAASVNGGAAQELNKIAAVLSKRGLPYTSDNTQIKVNLPNTPQSIRFIADGDNIVLTSAPAFDNDACPIKADKFGDDCWDAVIKIPANSPQITYVPLPFGIEISTEADDDSSETVIKLTDTTGKFLENIINFTSNF